MGGDGGGKMRKKLYSLVAALIASLVPVCAWTQTDNASPAASGQPQVVQPQEGGVNWKGVGIGAGTVASNLVYVPAKLAYGILGGIAGGAGYALTGGNKDVAETIWRSSLGGDYVLTPEKITGDQPIYFSGPSTPAAAPTSAPANSSSASTSNVAQSSPSTSNVSSGISTTGSGTQPIDNGAGPVHAAAMPPSPDPSGASNSEGGYHSARGGTVSTFKAPPLPDTSIE
jgi:hypothetical protein